jgi:predicted ArsR family transcriptional regulator
MLAVFLDSVRESEGEYRLFSPPGCEVRVKAPSAPAAPKVRNEELARALRKKLGARAFTASEAAEALGLSYAGAKRQLNAARADGLLERTGAGPATRFRVV